MNNVTDSLKPTYKTSYFAIFAATILIGPFVLIGLLWLANTVLPPADADAFKKPLFALWATIAGASGIGTIVGGLLRTYGKVTTQKDLAVAEATKGQLENLLPGEPLRYLGQGEVGTLSPEAQVIASGSVHMGGVPDFRIDAPTPNQAISNILDETPAATSPNGPLGLLS